MEFGFGTSPVLSTLLSSYKFFFKVSFIAQPTWHQKRPCSYHSEQLLVQHVALGPVWFILVGKNIRVAQQVVF